MHTTGPSSGKLWAVPFEHDLVSILASEHCLVFSMPVYSMHIMPVCILGRFSIPVCQYASKALAHWKVACMLECDFSPPRFNVMTLKNKYILIKYINLN